MITNDRQYKIAKALLYKIEEKIISSSSNSNVELSKIICRDLSQEHERLKDQLEDYDRLKSGQISEFELKSMKELPIALIKARVARGLTQKELANRLGCSEQQIQRYESQLYESISLSRLYEIADLLGLEINPTVYLNKLPLEAISRQLEIEDYPVAEMYKRGWFPNFKGSLAQVRREYKQLINEFFSDSHQKNPALFKRHLRMGSRGSSSSLLIWQERVIQLAKEHRPKRNFDLKLADWSGWFRELRELSSIHNGPVLAKEFLWESGICLVLEPHFPKTYVDGMACFSSDGIPIVGMTLRHDRLDNFWFVLFHELAHISLHLNASDPNEIFLDDIEKSGEFFESEADEYAGENLISTLNWNTSPARFIHDAETINACAEAWKISPAIIAGRIRRERNDYKFLGNLVGQGEVRTLFKL